MDSDFAYPPPPPRPSAMRLDALPDVNLGSKAFRSRMTRHDVNCDRQIDRAYFNAIERMVQRTFTVDAAADDCAETAMCKRFCCPSRSFMTAPLQPNDLVWVNAPFHRIGQWLSRYRAMKAQDSSLSACFLVPAWRSAAWMSTARILWIKPSAPFNATDSSVTHHVHGD